MTKSTWQALSLLSVLLLLPGSAAQAQEAQWSADMNKAKFDISNGSYDDAESLLRDSLDKAKEVPDKRAVVFSNLELGNLYLAWNRGSSAQTFFAQAVDEAKNIDQWMEAYTLRCVVEQSRRAGNDSIAKHFEEKARKLSGIIEQSDPAKFTAFMQSMNQALRKKWTPPMRNTRERTSLVFWLGHDGKPSLVHVTASSGDADEDARAVEAVSEAGPYTNVPRLAPEHGVAVAYTFDYKPAAANAKAPDMVPVDTTNVRHRHRRAARRDP